MINVRLQQVIKYTMLLLALIMVFGLCSCGKAPKTNGDNTQEHTDSVDTSEMVVFHISVNPELKLYTTEKGIVEKVEPLNEDAEKICNALQLKGLSYGDSFGLIVEKLKEGNYVNDGKKLSVQVIVPPQLGGDVDTWQTLTINALTAALDQYQVNCGFSLRTGIAEGQDFPEKQTEQPSTPDTTDEADKSSISEVLDESGNIVKTVETDPDGNIITAFYSQYPQVKEVLIEFHQGGWERMFYLPDGMLERSESVDVQGVSVETFYNQNEMVKQITNKTEELFYQNGVLVRELLHMENGTIERTYNAQGVLECVVETWPTSVVTMIYHSEGWLQKVRHDYEDSFSEVIYQAENVLLSEENTAIPYKYVYDHNGEVVQMHGLDNHGRYSQVFRLPDGRAVIYVHEFDGTITKSVQAPNNGSILSEISNYTGPITGEVGTLVPPVGHP